MIRCCYCGIQIGEAAYGFMTCPSCEKEIFAVVGMGKSFKRSQVTIDYDNETINIEPENEIPQKED